MMFKPAANYYDCKTHKFLCQDCTLRLLPGSLNTLDKRVKSSKRFRVNPDTEWACEDDHSHGPCY